MLPLDKLITIDKSSNTAVYLQISNTMIHQIRSGRLRKGTKLPGSRKLAESLQVHRNTLLAAYDELQAQGWIETEPRKGTFVVQDLPDIQPQGIVQTTPKATYPRETAFTVDESRIVQFPSGQPSHEFELTIDDGFPDIREAPIEAYTRELRSLSRRSVFNKYYRYGSPEGVNYLRETLSSFLNDSRGLPISPGNIMITNGAQMGIYLTARLLIRPGDHVIVGDPCFWGATRTLQQTGAEINRVPVDGSGMDIDAVERLCKKKEIKLLYIITHHQHPTTVTLSPKRRIRLLELAAEYDFAIIEDDYDYNFHYASSPILPMASLDQHGNVIYIGTLSKTLVPSIRMGFVVAPENFITAVSHQRRAVDWQGDSLKEVAIARLYENGTMDRHIKKMIRLYRERRDRFCGLLQQKIGDRVSFDKPDGGMSAWATFLDNDLNTVEEKSRERGLRIPNSRVYNKGSVYNTIRLGFASLNFKEQERAVEILSKSLS
ncbi:GntR family transcriptional regulator / MocR family aminotransferase [Fodinibius roseus]|uniref:GntR family transcriptional regulator / MocR family aminotransferase n=1 Tax=Fodinibius roseus TaxID=1194090 RepID=A0A1M4YWG2_9BACT|nr:PLP-dependent aminotransferase family protein [Fodinibius roseus]SHF10141.1 GntR family transcriptional regulator / MocR family aminotransferase [Fodinibius roseus]